MNKGESVMMSEQTIAKGADSATMKNGERILGFILLGLLLVAGKSMLVSDMIFFRLVVGIGLGYALSRAYTGFAGSVNRALNAGSTKLMRAMMFMFFISAVITAGLLFNNDVTSYGLWINPINLGLILGGISFGYGMGFSTCCASGVMTDLVTGLPRAFVTLIFFMLGVFLGFPIQNRSSIVQDSWFTSETGLNFKNGVFLPDLFKLDGMGGYLGALGLIAVFCGIVVFLSFRYEKKRKQNGTYKGLDIERLQDTSEPFDPTNFKVLSEDTYYRVFAKPWTLLQGGLVLTLLYTVLMGVTRSGWGASTPYGLWWGKLMMIFGTPVDSIANFTKMKPSAFLLPFFEHPVSVQNFGIIMGTLVFMLTAGQFKKMFTSELRVTPKEVVLFAMGGFFMGFGTRLANGCNVGALYTPIANLSLSGWFFLAAMVVGGIIGKKVANLVKA